MSIDDINKVRGKLLFWKVIRESGLDGKYLDRATELAKGFENQVGISGDCEAIYPAKRLATAILEVATWDYEIAGFDLGPDQVLKYFSENLKDNNPANIERSTFRQKIKNTCAHSYKRQPRFDFRSRCIKRL